MRQHLLPVALAVLAHLAAGVDVTSALVQLTEADIGDFVAISFGNRESEPSQQDPECKAFPGSMDWPTDHEWSNLNRTIGGDLLDPTPPAAVCYPGPLYNATLCSNLTRGSVAHTYLEDPLTVLTQWPQGSTCMPTLSPQGNCTRGGFPAYVVNATSVKNVQAAVNFARNKNIRLVIK